MAKTIKLNLSFSGENEFYEYLEDSSGILYINNKEQLQSFINDFVTFYNLKEKAKRIRQDLMEDNLFYYTDNKGKEVKTIHPERYNCHTRTNEELKKIVDEKIKDYIEYFQKIIDGNYIFENVKLNTNNYSFTDFKEVLDIVKDNVKEVDISILSFKEIVDLVNTVEISDKVKIKTKYNYNDTCTFTELKEIVSYFNNIVNYIKRFDLSPFEICIFVNDLLREKRYKESDEEIDPSTITNKREYKKALESTSYSRSLFKVYKSDEIVCAGFANMYSAILDLFNIQTDNLYFKAKQGKVGHVSNIVFLNDKKYNLEGIYEIDTTWGRIMGKNAEENYQHSIYNYHYFARNLDETIYLKEKDKLILEYNSGNKNRLLFELKNRMDRLKKLTEIGAPNVIVTKELTLIKESIEKYSQKINGSYFDETIKTIKKAINKCTKNRFGIANISDIKSIFNEINNKIFKSSIDHRIFSNALYKVKLVEHSIDKNKYPFNEKMFNIGIRTRFASEHMVLDMIFGKPDVEMKEIDDKEKLEIARMELLSTLRRMSNDSTRENPLQYKKIKR